VEKSKKKKRGSLEKQFHVYVGLQQKTRPQESLWKMYVCACVYMGEWEPTEHHTKKSATS
jgi:hypothetical protein